MPGTAQSLSLYPLRPHWPGLFVLAMTLTACGGGSSSNNGGGNGAPLRLSAHSDIMQVHLHWSGHGNAPVDILYSSDSTCDWDNVTSCDPHGSGVLHNVGDDNHRLAAVTHDLDPARGWYFVVEQGGQRSNMVGGRAFVPSFGEYVSQANTHQGRLYVTGSFSAVSAVTGSGALLDATTGHLTGSSSYVDGRIETVVSDGQGGWYIGGDFTAVDGEPRTHLARILPSGAVDPAWAPFVDDVVTGLNLHQGAVYVSGAFKTPHDMLAAFNPETGAVLDWTPPELANSSGSSTAIHSLLFNDDTVYIGGSFTSIDGNPHHNLAALNLGTGEWLDGFPKADGEVMSFAIDSDILYIGGNFTELNGQPHTALAAIDVSTGSLLGWQPTVANVCCNAADVSALLIHNDILYAAGQFTGIDYQERIKLAAFDVRGIREGGGTLTDWSPALDVYDQVGDLALYGNTLYVVGRFGAIDNQPRGNLAAFDATTGALQDWSPKVNDHVNTAAISNGAVYIGGRFQMAHPEARNSLAVFDANTRTLLPWAPDLTDGEWPGGATALAFGNDTLYIGGWFTEVNGEPRSNLASFDLETNKLLPWAPEIDGSADKLVIDNGALYVSGFFSNAGDTPRKHLAAFDAHGGELLPWAPQVDSQPRSLVIYDGVAFTARDFTIPYFSAFDTDTGEAHPWAPPITGTATTLAVHDNALYVAGNFTDIDGQPRSGLAAFRADEEELVLLPFSPPDIQRAWSLAFQGNTLYIDGDVSTDEGTSTGLAAIELDTSAVRDLSFHLEDDNSSGSGYIASLHAAGGLIYAVGQFTSVNDVRRHNLAIFDADTGELRW